MWPRVSYISHSLPHIPLPFYLSPLSFLFKCPVLIMCLIPSFLTLLSLRSHLFSTLLFLWVSFPTPGEASCKHIFKIPLCNLVGRSIERPLKSPLVHKVLTAPAPAMVPPTPLISATHSLSLSRMEIKEIASRTRKELLGKLNSS